jgi:hypothetical protein
MDWLVYFLVVFGITNIVTREYIFWNFREWIYNNVPFLDGLFSCPTCFGFWVGLLCYGLFPYYITWDVGSYTIYIQAFISGIVSSAANNLIIKYKEF